MAATVTGLEGLRVALAKAAHEIEAGAHEAVAAAVKVGVDAARSGAPVDTGELRDSLEGEAHGGEGTIRATAGHAADVEYGAHGPAQPFMTPAAERARAEFAALTGTAIASRLRRA